jgi:hypothetical protein
MPKRKRSRDLNQLAKFIVDVSTGEAELPECQPDGKNPAAVELGKLGGKSRLCDVDQVVRDSSRARNPV